MAAGTSLENKIIELTGLVNTLKRQAAKRQLFSKEAGAGRGGGEAGEGGGEESVEQKEKKEKKDAATRQILESARHDLEAAYRQLKESQEVSKAVEKCSK